MGACKGHLQQRLSLPKPFPPSLACSDGGIRRVGIVLRLRRAGISDILGTAAWAPAALRPRKAVRISSPREIRPQSQRRNGHPDLISGLFWHNLLWHRSAPVRIQAAQRERGRVRLFICCTWQTATPAAARWEGDAGAPTPMLFKRSLKETSFGGCDGGGGGLAALPGSPAPRLATGSPGRSSPGRDLLSPACFSLPVPTLPAALGAWPCSFPHPSPSPRPPTFSLPSFRAELHPLSAI